VYSIADAKSFFSRAKGESADINFDGGLSFKGNADEAYLTTFEVFLKPAEE
jgi:hypothetical protein